MDVLIAPLQDNDYPLWLPLWVANNHGVEDAPVTARTWARLMDPASAVHGLGALVGDDLAGILHYVLHPTTGNLRDVCYMQDLYVAQNFRRRGIARALVEALAQRGKQEGWARIYWLAEPGNAPAQALYRSLGLKLDFSLHVLPLTG